MAARSCELRFFWYLLNTWFYWQKIGQQVSGENINLAEATSILPAWMLKLNLFNSFAFITFKVLHNLSPDLLQVFPWFFLHACWDMLQHPATLNRISGRSKCMDGCFFFNSSWEWSLSASGWWTAWVELFLHSKESTDKIPETPKTDWLTFLWVLILTPTDHIVIILVNVQSYQCWHRHCCVVNWDGTGTTTDLWNLTMWCFCQKKKFSIKNNLLHFLLLGLSCAHLAWSPHVSKWTWSLCTMAYWCLEPKTWQSAML